MALHAGSHAAGEAPRQVLVLAPHGASDRHHVARRAVCRIHGAEDVIEEGAFVELRVPDVGLQREEPPRQLEHVVDVAGLRRAAVDDAAQLIRFPEVLVLPVPAGREGVVAHDAIPEEGRRRPVVTIAGVRVADRRPEELRHLRVAVQAVQPILAVRERVEHRAVIELVREREPAAIAGIRVQIRQHLVHPAELGVEHLLQLRVAERGEHALGPRRELHLDVQRRAVAPRTCRRRADRRTSCAACTTATIGHSDRMRPT